MVRTPEGKCYWPSFPVEKLLAVADIRQLQLQQTALDRIKVLLAMDEAPSPKQSKRLEQQLQQSLNYPFNFDFERVDAIPIQKNGKYEDFISLL
jgi:hypothetical protein